MSRVVPRDKPLSDEDRAYLHARGEHTVVEAIDAANPVQDAEDDGLEEKPNWSAMTKDQLVAEVARVNAEFAVDPALADTGTKAEIVARLDEWWNTPDDGDTPPPAA
jgi:hypothetical protein